MWSFDSDVLQAGVSGGLEALGTAAGQVARLREDPSDVPAVDEVGACFNQVGRMAASAGLPEIRRSAEAVESAVDRIRQVRRTVTRDEVALLDETVSLMTTALRSVDARTGSHDRSVSQEVVDRIRRAGA